MNLRQLAFFQQIAEFQSITRAANVLHIAQPALSRQMHMLEQDLGVLLFVRSDKGVRLTPAGEALYERAGSLLQQMRHIREEIGLYASEPKGSLRFGLPPSLFDLLTVPLVTEYSRRYPEVRLLINEGLSAAMHELVLTDKLDAAIVSDAEPLGLLVSRPLLTEQLYLVGPRQSGLDTVNLVPPRTLAERPMILTTAPNAMRLIVDRALEAEGRRIEPVLEANSSRILCELVSQGAGYTVLPYSAVFEAHRAGRLDVAPIAELSVTWTLVTARDRNLSLAGQRLRECIQDKVDAKIATGWWLGAHLPAA